MEITETKKIVIVGGGFAGVQAALDLSKKVGKNIHIQLISDKPHFEYHAALYRVVTGKSPLEVCIPLSDIFENTRVETIVDSIQEFNLSEKIIRGESGSHYTFDYIVLALGSETTYFNIPGIKEYSYGFKSISEALKLKRHLHSISEEISKEINKDKAKLEFVVVGAGASGTELSGELAVYLKKLFSNHGLSPSLFEIRLLDAAPSVMSTMPSDFSNRIKNRLEDLKIKVETSMQIMEENTDSLMVKGDEIHTKTVIWTAGIQNNHAYKNIIGLQLDPKGKVVVEPTLQTKGFDNVYVGGDAASVQYAGMAQTAMGHGKTIAQNIFASLYNKTLQIHKPKKPIYSIPVGPGWTASMIGSFKFYGKTGWIIRRFLDLRFFLSILPVSKAVTVFMNGKRATESCPVCSEE